MAKSKMKVTLPYRVEKVWNVVTNLKDYKWRSDLEKIEVINDKKFNEYTKSGLCTEFIVTHKNQYQRWEFDLENALIKGHWIGTFSSNDWKTLIIFEEKVTAKKIILKPFMRTILKKMQREYIRDLKIALESGM